MELWRLLSLGQGADFESQGSWLETRVLSLGCPGGLPGKLGSALEYSHDRGLICG